MCVVRDGKTTSFGVAMETIKSTFSTGVIKGNKPKPASHRLDVPYHGNVLSGKALQEQLKQ
jgi:hypothetical protein